MGRDYEPPVRDRDDVALRPVHRPPRIRGEREPRPAGSAPRVSDDVLGLDERTERDERESSTRGSRVPEERSSGERRSREEPRADRVRPTRPRGEEPRRPREDEDGRLRPRGDEMRGRGDGPRAPGREGAGERRTRRPHPDADRAARARAERGLRDEDHGPRLEHQRPQGDPRRRPKQAEPKLTKKKPRPAKAVRAIRPDEAADRAMGSGRSAKSTKPDRRSQSGPRLLDDATRARYEMIAREQSGLRACALLRRRSSVWIRKVAHAARRPDCSRAIIS